MAQIVIAVPRGEVGTGGARSAYWNVREHAGHAPTTPAGMIQRQGKYVYWLRDR